MRPSLSLLAKPLAFRREIRDAALLLSGESNSSAAPPRSGAGTMVRQVVRATVAADERGEEEGEGEAVVEMVDAPPLPEAAGLTRLDVEVAIGGELAPECVVWVLRCGCPAKARKMAVRKLPDIAGVIRERGLHLVVVLTHKKAIKTLR